MVRSRQPRHAEGRAGDSGVISGGVVTGGAAARRGRHASGSPASWSSSGAAVGAAALTILVGLAAVVIDRPGPTVREPAGTAAPASGPTVPAPAADRAAALRPALGLAAAATAVLATPTTAGDPARTGAGRQADRPRPTPSRDSTGRRPSAPPGKPVDPGQRRDR